MASIPAQEPVWRIEFDRPAQFKAVVAGLAFLAVFYNVVLDLQNLWLHESDWSHGPIIPLFSAWLVYANWEQIRRCPIRYTGIGLVIMLAALVLYQYSLWGLLFGYIRPVAMLLCLLGMIIFLCGLPAMRYLWLPWAYLFFAIPIPKRVYFALTDPLRRLAATVASVVLSAVPGLQVERTGSLIEYLYNGKYGAIGVVDACSGMRSTITLCALGVAVAYLSPRPWWHRLIMVVACVPIAVFCNFIRVTVTCALYIFVDAKYAEGTYHTALGLVMLLLAFSIFTALGWVLTNLFVEESESEPTRA